MGNTMAQLQEKGPHAMMEVNTARSHEDTKVEDSAMSSNPVKKVHNKLKDNVSCCQYCFDIIFVILSVLTLIKSIGEIFVTISGAISTRLFSTEQSGQLVGLVLLALLAAVTVSILIYALLAIFRKQAKPLHAAALVLIITAVLQSVIVGVAVRKTPRDNHVLEEALRESFDLARQESPRHAQLWAAIQNDLTCCGLNSPYDYRASNLPDIVPPNVPISCCPSYDPTRSDLVQERDRQACKLNRTYYTEGCRKSIQEVINTTTDLVLALTISLIIFEVILSILSAILHKKIKNLKDLIKKVKKEPEQV